MVQRLLCKPQKALSTQHTTTYPHVGEWAPLSPATPGISRHTTRLRYYAKRNQSVREEQVPYDFRLYVGFKKQNW